jgi:predicted metal-binding membrane protein
MTFASLIAGAPATVAGWASMSAMGGTPMPGGWRLSTIWTPMCGRSWMSAAAAFLGMWVAMTWAMMSPALAPALRRHHRAVRAAGAARPSGLTAIAGAGYFLVWTLLGAAAFPAGALSAAAAMHQPALARAVPLAAGLVVVAAGAFQFTGWKARRLACCCAASPSASGAASPGVAFRYGVRLGLDCCLCCAGLTAALFAVGIMNLAAMALATVAVTAERLGPAPQRAARWVGACMVGAGLCLVARAAGG